MLQLILCKVVFLTISIVLILKDSFVSSTLLPIPINGVKQAVLAASNKKDSKIILSNEIPIDLTLKCMAVTKNETTGNKEYMETFKKPSTKVEFFINSLGLRPGNDFEFDITKWYELQRSGLFANITAKSVLNKDGTATVIIKGFELPSKTFSPEISAAASIDNPEVSGGLSFIDRNFRGIGERFEVIIAKKEGKRKGTAELLPTTRFSWQDNRIGKNSDISVVFDEEHSFESKNKILPVYMFKQRYSGSGGNNFATDMKGQTMIRKVVVGFKTSSVVALPKTLKWLHKMVGTDTIRGIYDMQPYYTLIHYQDSIHEKDSIPSITALDSTGSKVSATFVTGFLDLLCWIDRGIMKMDKKKYQYNSIGSEINFKPYETNINALRYNASANTFYQKSLIMTNKVKVKLMQSWDSGCIPMFHMVSLGDSATVRGGILSGDGMTTQNDFATAYGIVKIDSYASGITLKPGIFVDTAVYKIDSSSSDAESSGFQTSVGLSARLQGFRLDCGWPINGFHSLAAPRLYLAPDV